LLELFLTNELLGANDDGQCAELSFAHKNEDQQSFAESNPQSSRLEIERSRGTALRQGLFLGAVGLQFRDGQTDEQRRDYEGEQKQPNQIKIINYFL